MPRAELASVVTFAPKKMTRFEERHLHGSDRLSPPLTIAPPPSSPIQQPQSQPQPQLQPPQSQLQPPQSPQPPSAQKGQEEPLLPPQAAPWHRRHCLLLLTMTAILWHQSSTIMDESRRFWDQHVAVNTKELVLQTEQVVWGTASGVLSEAMLWSARACVYTGVEKHNCTSMLHAAHEYMQSNWFALQPISSISPLHADVQRIGRRLHLAVTNITARITANLTENVQELVLRHALAPVLSSLLRLIKPRPTDADTDDSTDATTDALVDDVLAYIEAHI